MIGNELFVSSAAHQSVHQCRQTKKHVFFFLEFGEVPSKIQKYCLKADCIEKMLKLVDNLHLQGVSSDFGR